MGLKVLGWISTKSNDLRTGMELFHECCSSRFARTYGGFLAQKLLNGCIALEPTLKKTRFLGAFGMVASGATLARHSLTYVDNPDKRRELIIPILMQVRIFANASAHLLKGLEVVGMSEILIRRKWVRAEAAYRIMQAAAKPLWMVGTALSVMFLVVHVKEYAETVRFLRKLMKGEKSGMDESQHAPVHYQCTEHQLIHSASYNVPEYPFLARIGSVLNNMKWMLATDALFAVGSWSVLMQGKPSLFSKVCRGISFTMLQSNYVYQYFSAKRFCEDLRKFN